MGAGVTKATRGQSNLKAVHKREKCSRRISTSETGRLAGRRIGRTVFFFVRIQKLLSDWRSKFVRQMCSDWEVFESKGVRIKRYHCNRVCIHSKLSSVKWLGLNE